MKRAAKILSWIALVYGVPTMLLSMTWVFVGGWQMLMFLALIALPPLPMILTMDSTGWRTQPPIVPLALALLSLYVSTRVYQNFFHFRIL